MNGMISAVQSFLFGLHPLILVTGVALLLVVILILITSRFIVIRLIRKKGIPIINHFGMAETLQRKMLRFKSIKHARQLLDLPENQGIVWVFLAALKKESLADVFKTWVKDESDFSSISSMALAAKDCDFDGRKAWELLNQIVETLRVLAGDSQWSIRYFALRVLVFDKEGVSIRMAENFLYDTHPLIRRTAVRDAKLQRDESINHLRLMALNDPVFEVRKAARTRIDSFFPNIWQFDCCALTAVQFIHVLEQMKTDSRVDENMAMAALQNDSGEARLIAARFLGKSGVLSRMFGEAHLGDMEDWERRYKLLDHAVSVGIAGFLSALHTEKSIDVLLIGARLLQNGGSAEFIAPLAEKAFMCWPAQPPYGKELYREVMRLACVRGDEKAWILVREELKIRRTQNDMLSFILPQLPRTETHVFRAILLEFLIDPEFSADDAYLDIMAKVPYSMLINPVLDVLEAGRAGHCRHVRLRALRILGAWRLEQTLQIMIEHLSLLPPERYSEFREHFAKMDDDTLEKRAVFIIESPDAALRAALISCLPAMSVEGLSELIRRGLKDAIPEIRIACAGALSRAGNLLATEEIATLLHDPVEGVRQEAASIAGKISTKQILNLLESLLFNVKESPRVRLAAMEGLAVNQSLVSVDALVRFLSTGSDLRDELLMALSSKNSAKALMRLITYFKDSDAVLKEKLTEVFTKMGEAQEERFSQMLREINLSMKPFLVDILTRTGFVTLLIKRLGERTVQSRREAAELLTIIATPSAYRGIVLAVRDPDTQVRVLAVRALEVLMGEDNEKILQSLLLDPDQKVRRYTQWATERIKAKKLP